MTPLRAGLLVIVVLLLIGVLAFTTGSASAALTSTARRANRRFERPHAGARVLVAVSGSHSMYTPSFLAAGPFVVGWKARVLDGLPASQRDRSTLTIELHTDDGTAIATVVEDIDPSTGQIVVHPAAWATYRLHIRADNMHYTVAAAQ